MVSVGRGWCNIIKINIDFTQNVIVNKSKYAHNNVEGIHTNSGTSIIRERYM